jgi:enoyl-CoA hydratase/carnithine racemase
MIEEADVAGVRVISMVATENQLQPEMVHALHHALDTAETAQLPVVLTGEGKFFSNGLDLAWLGTAPADDAAACFADLDRLLARLVVFPLPTAAAVNGHAFGAGAILAAAADFRVMREDRGYFCFPEIDLGLPMTAGFEAICTAKFATPSLLRAWSSGTRYPAPDARRLGFVDEVAAADDVTRRAAELLAPASGKDPRTMTALKRSLYGTAVDALSPGR